MAICHVLGQGPVFRTILSYIWINEENVSSFSTQKNEKGNILSDFDPKKAREVLEVFAGYAICVASWDLRKYMQGQIRLICDLRFKARTMNAERIKSSTFVIFRAIRHEVNSELLKERGHRRQLLIQLSDMLPRESLVDHERKERRKHQISGSLAA